MQDSKRDTDVKNGFLDSVGEGKGGTIWENSSIETCILPYLKQMTSLFDAWNRALKAGALGWPRRDGMGREVRGEVQDGGRMYTHGWFMSMYGKNQHNIVK